MKNNERLCQISKILIWITTPMTKPNLRKFIAELPEWMLTLKRYTQSIHKPLDKQS